MAEAVCRAERPDSWGESASVFEVLCAGHSIQFHEQALVCLVNREIVHASRGRTFPCKMANTR